MSKKGIVRELEARIVELEHRLEEQHSELETRIYTEAEAQALVQRAVEDRDRFWHEHRNERIAPYYNAAIRLFGIVSGVDFAIVDSSDTRVLNEYLKGKSGLLDFAFTELVECSRAFNPEPQFNAIGSGVARRIEVIQRFLIGEVDFPYLRGIIAENAGRGIYELLDIRGSLDLGGRRFDEGRRWAVVEAERRKMSSGYKWATIAHDMYNDLSAMRPKPGTAESAALDWFNKIKPDKRGIRLRTEVSRERDRQSRTTGYDTPK